MKALLKEFAYIHSLFSFMLYLVGNFIVIIVLEYKLNNPHFKHTLAGFASIALSGVVAYSVPMYISRDLSPVVMQTIGIMSAFLTQSVFWLIWFRRRFKELAPALAIAFIVTVVVSLVMYFSFMAYVQLVIKETVENLGPVSKYLITNF